MLVDNLSHVQLWGICIYMWQICLWLVFTQRPANACRYPSVNDWQQWEWLPSHQSICPCGHSFPFRTLWIRHLRGLTAFLQTWGIPRCFPLTDNPVLSRLQRDPAPHDDGPAQVPPGEAGGSGGVLPAAQQHPGGAIPEGCGESWRSYCGQPHPTSAKPWTHATNRTSSLKKQCPSLLAFLSVDFYPWVLFIYVCAIFTL